MRRTRVQLVFSQDRGDDKTPPPKQKTARRHKQVNCNTSNCLDLRRLLIAAVVSSRELTCRCARNAENQRDAQDLDLSLLKFYTETMIVLQAAAEVKYLTPIVFPVFQDPPSEVTRRNAP